jgi:cytochrome c2
VSLKPVIFGMVLLTAGAFWLAAIGLIFAERRGRRVSDACAAAVCLAAAATVLAVGAAIGSSAPRTVVLWAPLLGFAMLAAGRLLRPVMSWKLVAVLVLVAGVGLGLVRAAPGWVKARAVAKEKPSTAVFQIRSALYDLKVTSYRNYTPRTPRSYGGLTLFADRYLLVDGSGNLFAFRQSSDRKSLDFSTLAYKVPINYEEFIEAAGTTVTTSPFRVADILAQEKNGMHRVFVSHHFWKAAERCWVMRVSSLQGSLAAFEATEPAMRWETIFESQPCIPLAIAGEAPRFNGMENGGRLALLGDDGLLVTIGDHGMDGWPSSVQASQEMSYSHGKIHRIDLADRTSEIYSLGHRNPQGLIVTTAGEVWSTEHGPEGGDELNLIREGGNYGWPLVSYGTEYGTHGWPLSVRPGSHDGFLEPYFSWVPSIGVSGLLEMTSQPFENWRGDLLVYSLRAEAFHRLRARDGRTVMVEHIPFGERIREVIQGHAGELVVWADGRNIHFVEPLAAGDPVSGQSIYRICAACHVAARPGAVAIGPDLSGIVGRAVAADRKFDYTPAMQALGGAWTRERLDAFLTDPAAFVPGTSMVLSGIPDPVSRSALIEFLAAPESRLHEAPPRPAWD